MLLTVHSETAAVLVSENYDSINATIINGLDMQLLETHWPLRSNRTNTLRETFAPSDSVRLPF